VSRPGRRHGTVSGPGRRHRTVSRPGSGHRTVSVSGTPPRRRNPQKVDKRGGFFNFCQRILDQSVPKAAVSRARSLSTSRFRPTFTYRTLVATTATSFFHRQGVANSAELEGREWRKYPYIYVGVSGTREASWPSRAASHSARRRSVCRTQVREWRSGNQVVISVSLHPGDRLISA